MKIKKTIYCIYGFVAILTLTACDNNSQTVTAETAETKPAILKMAQSSMAPSGNTEVISGKVAETKVVNNYTYLRIEKGSGSDIWAAIPKTQVKTGEMVTLKRGMMMKDFTSKSLNRTFKEIIFASGIILANSTRASSNANKVTKATSMSQQGAMGASSTDGKNNIIAFSKLKIKKATAANAQTVKSAFQQVLSLDKQKVSIRGQVVKVSNNIMGKNWLHIQDGTGDPSQNTHDLVVTTMGNATKGSIVTIEGIVAANKDFGSGYLYKLIIEDATVTLQ